MIQQLKNNINYGHNKQFDVPKHRAHYSSSNIKVVTIKYRVSFFQCYFFKKTWKFAATESWILCLLFYCYIL